ncbi:hypothetical protein Vqi01_46760 [Micromonospora qiuiae]|uniref:Methyltransferase domain-containing protein n=1 Tax=Micromonospora qiuiae TaxID=502268 RepID=A0ABQ4JJ25_9ACTN|nr:class I SAM-dependent methyltransferase [Micromonospora qiuiae]GIJ29514.1 hypothetical protein Vqi01_46760 [Micromonospora qiuiae]
MTALDSGKADTPVANLVESFVRATPDRLGEEFRRLAAKVWEAGTVTAAAPDAVPALVAALDTAPAPAQRARLALLLGLLAEASAPSAEAASVRQAVHSRLPGYLELLLGTAEAAADEPIRQALLFLVAHFPEDREEILAVAGKIDLGEEDLSRLERCLKPLDADDPAVTRVWPYPAVWSSLDEADRDFDRQWMRQLPAEQLALAWTLDTQSLLAYSGARAFWTCERGAVVGGPEPDLTLPTVEGVTAAEADPLGGHGAALRCPSCHAPLQVSNAAATCTGCGVRHPVVDGYLDLSAGAGDAFDPMTRTVPRRYSDIRPAFLRWKGSNWDGEVTVSGEDEYLRTHVRPVDGPILDLAAGTGRWTSVLAETFGADRVIALDLSRAMMEETRRGLPEVFGVRGNALALPFTDASLGAVNCWNALQSLPDPAPAIAEVGRCLRPGGTFTLMTFRPSLDPLYRYFQTRPFGLVPVTLSDPEQLRGQLAAAGMRVREQYTPGSFLFITAVRDRD